MKVKQQSVSILDTSEVIDRVLSGDVDAFADIVEAYEQQIFAMIMKQVGKRELVEELSQETFIRAFRFLKNFKQDSKLSTWLTRIALNTTRSYFSSKRFKQSQLSECLEKAPELKSSYDETAQKEHNMNKVRVAVASLKPKYREVVTLHSFEGKSYAEISEILSIPVGTVGSRMNYALGLIRKQVGRV